MTEANPYQTEKLSQNAKDDQYQEFTEKRVGFPLGAVGRSQMVELNLLCDIKELLEVLVNRRKQE